ncbi:SDR family oxidoreductase [Salsipaludibacter albus]|uniref:SDR family oxidoreductase n=1 Tax=Salsipaludibacter albus TaxID=2849650 RepID=UPI001EE4A8BA|nr:SDR family oxidoreductase [Salsipaludibacter albus]MBY5162128.1 SDR family oxidoreductase [Salsipaludibacter albus]
MSVAVVVGATGAIGRVVVARLVAEDHSVLAVGRDLDRLAELAAVGDEVETCRLDLADPGCGAVLVSALDGRSVRLLAHLASAPLGGDILDTPDDVLRAAHEVKVIGLLRLVRALVGHFDHPARIVAVGGNLGFDPVPHASTAGLANAAQANLVRQLNRRLAPDGVTCHTIAPGPVATARHRDLLEQEAEATGRGVDELLAAATAGAPLGRLTRPEEVAWAVTRLLDDEAAALAGSTLLLDAGRRTALP